MDERSTERALELRVTDWVTIQCVHPPLPLAGVLSDYVQKLREQILLSLADAFVSAPLQQSENRTELDVGIYTALGKRKTFDGAQRRKDQHHRYRLPNLFHRRKQVLPGESTQIDG